MINIIIITHGAFAAGLLDAAQLIIGQQENVLTFSLSEGDSIDQLEMDAENGIKTLSETGSVLVLVDLFGASPFNVSLRLLQRYPEIKIVTGANLPMLIEALMNRESMDLGELADHVAQTGRDHSKTLDEWMSSAN
jgi:PTS system mannose-specific IIA component